MTRTKQWSLGMAFYDNAIQDCHPESIRVTWTSMAASAMHPLIGEIILVDNNPLPNSPLPEFAQKMGNCRYVAMPEPKGTSAPRNRVFEEAKFPRVACIDSHVLLLPRFFEALNAFYEQYGWDCPDLLHGPMVEEDLKRVHGTHMNDQWRDHMWGTWGWAWGIGEPRHHFVEGNTCKRCGIAICMQRRTNEYCPKADYKLFSCIEEKDDPHVRYVTLGDGKEQSGTIGMGLPLQIGWAGHEAELKDLGCWTPEEPFQIPGHGMGFFACRKDAWLQLPFSDRCRGFGGEEMTTHRRFRKNGRRVWCIPGAKWWHHYGRAGQSTFQGPGHHATPPYPMSLRDRVRNYAIEFLRNGDDLKPVAEHFDSSENELKLLAKSNY